MDGMTVNGRFVPSRSCQRTLGTQSINVLRRMHPDWDCQPRYALGKHLYWIPLTKDGKRVAAELGLEKNPYPKPNPASEVTPATRQPSQVGEGGSAPTLTL